MIWCHAVWILTLCSGDHISVGANLMLFFILCVFWVIFWGRFGIRGIPQELTLYDVVEFWFLMFGCFEWRPSSDIDRAYMIRIHEIMHHPDHASSRSRMIRIMHETLYDPNHAWSGSYMIRINEIVHDQDHEWSRSCMHHTDHASSRSYIIQIMHYQDHALSGWRMIQIMRHPYHASSISCIIQIMHHPYHA